MTGHYDPNSLAYHRDWLLSACAYIPTAREGELIIQDALMKQVTIEVGVVSSFARRQQRSAAWFDRRSSRANTKTQQRTRVLHHDTRFCAVTPVVFLN